jgi:probable HAF family extracellular repeat protein
VFTDLGTLPGFQYAWATAINATGQVVGTVSNDAGPIDAFIWSQAAGMADLGPLPGYLFVHPYAINGQGVVVGEASNSANDRVAFVWQNGIMTNLNTLIPATSGWVLQIATGINDNGQIVGTGRIGGQVHGFLLTSTP